MRVEIKKIALENYKCFNGNRGKVTFDFSHRTKVLGRNRQGKSTIENAYLEVMTGKQLDGSLPSYVRPHDENGADLNRADVIREITLEIDGRPVTIRKRTFQKWRKPHGQTEEVFDGNGEDFEVDGFPYKPAKFKEYMAGFADPDILLMCSNANPFLATVQKSTADARRVLEKMSGFSLEQFIAQNPAYAAVAELTMGHSVEDAFKKLRRDLATQKKKIEAQNEKIKHEESRPMASGNIEISDLELMKGEYRDRIGKADEREKELDSASKDYDTLSEEIVALQGKKYEMETKERNILLDSRIAFRMKISGKETELRDKQFAKTNAKSELESSKRQADSYEKELQRIRAEYGKVSHEEFDETRLHQIEKEEFDESSLVCPTCGQLFPEWRAQEMRSGYSAAKKSRLDAEKSRQNSFFIEQDARLNDLTANGNRISNSLKELKKKIGKLEKSMVVLDKEIEAMSAEIDGLKAELDKMPETIDLSDNKDYAELCEKILRKEVILSTFSDISAQRADIRAERDTCLQEIAKIDGAIVAAKREIENRESILSILRTELREMAQVQANIERDIDTLSDFSRAKNSALAEKINPHFRHFQFCFLDYTIEGNPVETCKLVCDGTGYFSDLNGGDRKLVEIDLCRGLQEMNGLVLPIWADESNTIDPERIPSGMEQQLILLGRDDGDLRAEAIDAD